MYSLPQSYNQTSKCKRCISSNAYITSKGPVIIGDYTWIGENVSIMPGVNIGKSSVIGANSVVTKSFPERSIIAGNPAKIIGTIQ